MAESRSPDRTALHDGQLRLRRRGAGRRLPLRRRLPDHPGHRGGRAPGRTAAGRRRHLPADGGRDRLHGRHHRGLLGRDEDADRHLGPRRQPDAGEHRVRRRHRDAVRHRQRACGAARPPASPRVELQGDVIQVRRGSHGDYQIIALAPSSVQEMLRLHRGGLQPGGAVPDAGLRPDRRLPGPHAGGVAHSRTGRAIPIADRRLFPTGVDTESLPGFLDEDVAPMPVFGRGHKAHVTVLLPRRLRPAQRGRRLRPGCASSRSCTARSKPTGTRSSGSRRTWTGAEIDPGELRLHLPLRPGRRGGGPGRGTASWAG
ncbi:MAG: hypothetical protein M0C28_23000 [Candidatus Moduliflexus flocculans]|nr:hypothetical protein [Candidatus Moduliflexus flocculans]